MIRLVSIFCVSFLVGCATTPPEEMIGKPVKLTSYPQKVHIQVRPITHPEMLSYNKNREIYKGKLLSLNENTITIGLLDEWDKSKVVNKKEWMEMFSDLFSKAEMENVQDSEVMNLNYCHSFTIQRSSIEKYEILKTANQRVDLTR